MQHGVALLIVNVARPESGDCDMRPTVFAVILFLSLTSALQAAVSPQVPLDGATIPQFAQALPTLAIAPRNGTMTTIAGNKPITLRMCEFRAAILPPGTVENYAGTWVWGYLVDPTGDSHCLDLVKLHGNSEGIVDTYIGPVIVNERGKPTAVTYVNDLGRTSTTKVLAYKYATDQTLHWANPLAAPGEHSPCTDEMQIPAFGSPCAQNYDGPIAAVAHLHGGEVPAEIDGGPDSWFTSDGAHFGHKYYSSGAPANRATYKYPNTQLAAPIWFHDHTLGATRLNVYAGLAGAYLIHDPALKLPQNLQPLTEVVPLVLQDRMFDEQGQLYFPAGAAGGAPNPNHPYWIPEFIGDTIVVNGKAWPFFEVEPRRYRFLLLNGSNARTYELFLNSTSPSRSGIPMWVIGTDGGYLDAPARVNSPSGHSIRRRAAGGTQGSAPPEKLVIMPGERYEVIIDFGKLPAGTRVVLRNSANAPFPDGDPSPAETVGRVVEFRIGECPSNACGPGDSSFDPGPGTNILTGAQKIVRLVEPSTGTLASGVVRTLTRSLTLNEVMAEGTTVADPVTGEVTAFEGGPLEVLVNNTEYFGNTPRPYGDFPSVTVKGQRTSFSELPDEGTTEVWELVNLTADAHPIHLHLVQFQLMNRQAFDAEAYLQDYEKAFPGGAYLQGFGPPFDYRAANNPASGGKEGGNPDVTPFLSGPAAPPLPYERGWKDTVVAYPGQVTRLVVRWAPADLPVNAPKGQLFFPFDPSGGGVYNYVWHCHIIDHEDNEMMRPHAVRPNVAAPATRVLRRGTDY
jgi:spore coat protein A